MADPLILTPGQIALPDDFNAVLLQHAPAGVKPVQSVQIVPLTDPKAMELVTAAAQSGQPIDLSQTPLYQYYLADGTMVEAITQPDGQYRVVDYKPSQKFQQSQAAQTRQDGPQARNEAELQRQRERNAALPADQDPRYETDAERAARAQATIKAQGEAATAAQGGVKRDPIQAHPGYSTVTTVRPATATSPAMTESHVEKDDNPGVAVQLPPDASKPPTERVNPADPTKRQVWNPQANNGAGAWEDGGAIASEAPKPQQAADGSWGYWDTTDPKNPKWTPIQGPAGKKYSEVRFDENAGVWWGLTPSGQWERMQGGPGATTGSRGPGPNAPQIVLGHSQDALRQYGDTLNQAVANGELTPAQATQRWNQAVQTAQVAYNEATLLQREQESNLNASVSLANTRMSAANSGFNTALQVVANLNDKLPVGSDLGGKAFAAILGLQMAHAQRMGAYDNIRPGSQPSVRDLMSQPPPPPGPTATPAAPPPPAAEAAPPPTASPAVDQAPASPPPEPPAGEPESALPNFTDPTTGRFGIPGSFVTGPYSPPAAQGAGGDGTDYPVLAGLAPPPPPPTPMAFTPEPTYGSLPPALLYTQAASTPFWRMSPEEVATYQAAGIPDDVIRSGTMVAA